MAGLWILFIVPRDPVNQNSHSTLRSISHLYISPGHLYKNAKDPCNAIYETVREVPISWQATECLVAPIPICQILSRIKMKSFKNTISIETWIYKYSY